MDTNCSSRVQRKGSKGNSHRVRKRNRMVGEKIAHSLAGEGQKHHAVLNEYHDSERHAKAEGQLKPSFKLCYLKCQASKMRLNSLIWIRILAPPQPGKRNVTYCGI